MILVLFPGRKIVLCSRSCVVVGCSVAVLQVADEAAVLVDAAAEGGLLGRVALVGAGRGGEVLEGGGRAAHHRGPGGAAGDAEPHRGQRVGGAVAAVAGAPEQVGRDERGEEDECGHVGHQALVAHHGQQQVAERVGEHHQAERRGGQLALAQLDQAADGRRLRGGQAQAVGGGGRAQGGQQQAGQVHDALEVLREQRGDREEADDHEGGQAEEQVGEGYEIEARGVHIILC